MTPRSNLQFAFCYLHFAISLVLALYLGSPLLAAPPTLTSITPRGAQRGKAVEITVAGANLTPQTRLLLPFQAMQKYLPEAKPNPAQARFQLTVDPAVPLGVYPIRVGTADGVSSLFFFCVDAFPTIPEVENNDTFETAQKVSIPVIISGQCAGGDVDHYRFTAKQGQRIVVETEAARIGSGVSPQLRVMDAQKRFIGSDDTQSLRGDCRVFFVAPADGDYVVEFADTRYKGGNPPDYRLKIGEYDVVEEVFPLGGRRGESVDFTLRGGTLSSEVRAKRSLQAPPDRTIALLGLDGLAKVGAFSPRLAVGELPERIWLKIPGRDPKALDVLPPITINSRLEKKGDADRFQFPVQAGQRYRIGVAAQSLGSRLDGVLRVTDQTGRQLAQVDDVEVVPGSILQPALNGADPGVDIDVPAGASLLVVELRDHRRRGGLNFGYRLTIVPTVPDFVLRQPVSEINVPRGGSAVLAVPVVRRGYSGSIQLMIADLPPGLLAHGGHVPANGAFGILTLTASSQTSASAVASLLRIEGKATSEGKEIRRHAAQRIVMSQEAQAGGAVVTLTRFMLGLAGAEPFNIQGPAEVEVVLGYSTTVPVTVGRAKEQMALAVEVNGNMPQPPPLPGQPPLASPLTFKPGVAAAGVNQATVLVAAPVAAPEGTVDFVIQGKAKVNNADRTVVGPAVPVRVVRPFTVELLTPSLSLVPGQTIALKGRLQRKPVFKEPVHLRLDGLPAGVALAAPPRPLAGDWTEFQIGLRVDPKATPASASVTLACSATISGMAYAHPTIAVPAQVKAAK